MRYCDICDKDVLGDEFHTVMICDKLATARSNLFEKISTVFPLFDSLDNKTKFTFLMQCDDYDIARELITFIQYLITLRGNL